MVRKMDKNAENTINELVKKIEALQAKKEAVIKKEKERKAKAQEKWKGIFIKELVKSINAAFGEDYEEILLPEKAACLLGTYIAGKKDLILEGACQEIEENKTETNVPAASGGKS